MIFFKLSGKLFCFYCLYKVEDEMQTEYHQRVIPRSEIKAVMVQFYDSPLDGHFAFEKTFRNIQKWYWWPYMEDDINMWIKTCDTCQSQHSSK